MEAAAGGHEVRRERGPPPKREMIPHPSFYCGSNLESIIGVLGSCDIRCCLKRAFVVVVSVLVLIGVQVPPLPADIHT